MVIPVPLPWYFIISIITSDAIGADADYYSHGQGKGLPPNHSAIAALFQGLRLAWYILHQPKVYKLVSSSTIVLIDKSYR